MKQFVAWDKIEKEVAIVGTIDFKAKKALLFYKVDNYLNGKWKKFGEIIILQYTGIKDGLGAKIYEKNIIRESVNGVITRTFLIDSIGQISLLIDSAPKKAVWEIIGLNIEMEKDAKISNKNTLQS